MLNPIFKVLYFLKKPKIIVVTGKSADLAFEALFQVLRKHIKVRRIEGTRARLKDVISGATLLLSYSGKGDAGFLLRNSKAPILLVTHIGEILPDRDFFNGDPKDMELVIPLVKALPANAKLAINFDDETVRELKNKTDVSTLTFGFQEEADFRATDVFITKTPSLGTNFKINHKGKIVPMWLPGLFGKEHIYAALAAAAVGTILDLHLVEISEGLATYKGLPGRMRLLPGIKNTQILDDSASASVWSMAEGLEILGRIEATRKIAVLGDVLAVGKYAIEAHESLGERAVKAGIGLLFPVGPRAKFIAEGAKQKGLAEDSIFSFDTAEEAANKLKEKIKEGDFILVDGSKEMRMAVVVEALRV